MKEIDYNISLRNQNKIFFKSLGKKKKKNRKFYFVKFT